MVYLHDFGLFKVRELHDVLNWIIMALSGMKLDVFHVENAQLVVSEGCYRDEFIVNWLNHFDLQVSLELLFWVELDAFQRGMVYLDQVVVFVYL